MEQQRQESEEESARVARPALILRVRYAMSGSAIAHVATTLCSCYAVSGTDAAYAATRVRLRACGRRSHCSCTTPRSRRRECARSARSCGRSCKALWSKCGGCRLRTNASRTRHAPLSAPGSDEQCPAVSGPEHARVGMTGGAQPPPRSRTAAHA
eukprot:241548-Rhodomonas_salina.3